MSTFESGVSSSQPRSPLPPPTTNTLMPTSSANMSIQKQSQNSPSEQSQPRQIEQKKVPKVKTSSVVRLSSASSEDGFNPLVAKFEDLNDSDSDEAISHFNSTSLRPSVEAVVSNQRTQMCQSTSKKSTKPNYNPEISAALDDFFGGPNDTVAVSSQPKATKKKTKKISANEKLTSKTKKNTKPNILTDQTRPMDTEQYDPL